jgi:hypothetical protein
MYSSLCVKPYHLPIFVAMAFVLLTHSDARVPKKTRVQGHPQLLHHSKNKPHAKNASVPHGISPDNVVFISKRLYQELGHDHDHWNASSAHVSEEFRGEFDQLNSYTDGELGRTLVELFEIRMMDLQTSIKHARRMRDAIAQLVDTAACVLCTPKPSV